MFVQLGDMTLLELQSLQCVVLLLANCDCGWHSLFGMSLSPELSHGTLSPHIGTAFGGAGHGCVGTGGSALLEARLEAELAPIALTQPLIVHGMVGLEGLSARARKSSPCPWTGLATCVWKLAIIGSWQEDLGCAPCHTY
jgi:hypothetical protein